MNDSFIPGEDAAGSDRPVVSVIIPTFNDWPALARCLEGIARQTLPADRFEVIVVDNACAAKVPIQLPENAKLITERRPGSYAARNRGIEESRASVLAFTDADCIPKTRWLEKILDRFENPAVQRIAGEIDLFYSGAPLTPAECYEKAFAFDQAKSAIQGVAVTANLAVRRSVFEAVGVFDSTMMSGGDTEWNRRASNVGVPIVYDRECAVWHPARSSWAALAGKATRTREGSLRLSGLPRGWPWRAFVPPVEGARQLWGDSRMTAREKRYAWGVLYAIKVHRARETGRLLLKRAVGRA